MSRAAQENSEPDLAPVPDGPDPHMHAGKCTICKHPQRAEIERAFVNWCSPLEITKMFGIASRTTIYRHARARGLFELRLRNLHYGLGRIAEQVADVKPSAANVIAAFIAMAKINARGEWSGERRFEARETTERAHWELLSAAARENELEDTLAGHPAPVPAEQLRLREHHAKVTAESAARAAEKEAEAAKEAEPKEEAAKQEAEHVEEVEEAEELAEEQEGEQDEETQPEQATQPDSVAASHSPTALAQNKKPDEPESPRPHPIPQPPDSAPRPEDSGPPQVAGLPWPWPREKIIFARRRGRRPVVP